MVNGIGRIRRVIEDGREWIVAPLTTIVPGVLNGSKGALYYPSDAVESSTKSWDGTPLVVYHPNHLGQPVSARHPGVLERSGVGEIRNSVFRGKLQHEGWFDVERTKAVDPRVLKALESGTPMELSTGLYTDNEQAPPNSFHNGKQYEYVAKEYRPDHLAILPDQVGACSIADGCGVLINQHTTDQGVLINMGQAPNQSAPSQEAPPDVQPVQGPKAVDDKKKPIKVKTSGAGTAEAAQKVQQQEERMAANSFFGAFVEWLTGNVGKGQGRDEGGRFAATKGAPGSGSGPHHDAAVEGHSALGKGISSAPADAGLGDPNATDDDEVIDPMTGEPLVSSKGGKKVHNTWSGVENMDPHFASKQAAQASVGTEHEKGREFGLQALDHSKDDDSDAAAKAHLQAAKAHEKAATDARKDKDDGGAYGHDEAAALHRKAASCHQATMNTGTGDNDMNWLQVLNTSLVDMPDDERRAAAAHMDAGGGTGSKSAKAASKSADSASGHKKAAKEHRKAAAEAEDAGRDKQADAHREVAEHHDSMAKKMTKNFDRSRVMGALAANCSCANDVQALNGLSDATLQAIATINAFKKKSRDDDEDDDEDDSSVMERNDDDAPAFDRKGAGKGGVAQAGGKGTRDEYAGNRRSERPITERLSPEELEVWNCAREVEQRERGKLVGVLTANVQNPEAKKRLATNLMKKPMAELRDMTQLLPQVSRHRPDPDPIYNGAAAPGGPTDNSASDDLLEIPTLNFAEISKANASKAVG